MEKSNVSIEVVAVKILVVRGKKVMLDRDLAELYGVMVKRLNEQVKRNIRRFPDDFMFQLTKDETDSLRSHFATLSDSVEMKGVTDFKRGRHVKYLPYVFTEQGVAMLSSVLNSERAIDVNIAIMRAFVRLREILLTHKDLAAKIEVLELKYKNHNMKLSEYDAHIEAIFEAIKQLMALPLMPERPKIGFHP